MEPVRTKRCVVLLVVFALALGITPGCKPRQGEKPAAGEKKAAEKTAETAEKPPQRPMVEGLQTQAEGAVLKPSVAEAPPVGLKKKPAPLTTEPLTTAPTEAKSVAIDGDKPSGGKPDGDKPEDSKATGVAVDTAVDSAVDAAAAMPSQTQALADEIPQDETPQETAQRLGPPLVEQPDKLVRLDEVDPIWLDKPGGRLIMVGEVCQRQAPLEMFVCLWHTKEHESVLTVRVPAKTAHAGLLALGAKVGGAVQFVPEYIPARGTVIDINVIWKDAAGKIQQRRGQEWVRDLRTKQPMQHEWVFAGSGFWTDESTGQTHYQAQSGDFICVSNFSTAMLDLPVKSTQRNDWLAFMALTESIPPLGTPVTIVLKPRLHASGK